MRADSTLHARVVDRGRDSEGKPTYAVVYWSDDGAYAVESKNFKTEKTAWDWAYRRDKSPEVKERRARATEARAAERAAKATRQEALQEAAKRIQSNLTPAYLILLERKVTNEDITPEMIDAAVSAIDTFADDLAWSQFLLDMETRVRQGFPLTPGMARGVLNALRKTIIRHMEGRAAFEEQQRRG
jgi:hypothetical protein